MKLLQTYLSTAVAVILTVCVIGTPGLSHGQAGEFIYGTNSDKSSYYDPYDPYYFDDNILTDREIRRRTMRILSVSPFVDEEHIRVEVDKGITTLSGTVEDRSAMMDAVEIAYDSGAWKVQNKLRKRNWNNQPWAEMRDSELKEEIEDELAFSPFVNADQIAVGVRNGVATLYGGVENKGEIADAVENAYEAGAKRVKSNLWIDPDL
ncbi:MAG: hypothetical protein NPIRA04_15700 [Nitrospirales bacterium]|nr:MAG: hypothetical protein NPIRA04_15700 [Nitrospirales bacterium]